MEITLFCLFFIFIAVAGRRYKAHDHVGIVANTIGPFNNPTETYPVSIFLFVLVIFSYLPFPYSIIRCRFVQELVSNEVINKI
jgi:hypothetical protein